MPYTAAICSGVMIFHVPDRKYLTIFQEENPIGKFDALVG